VCEINALINILYHTLSYLSVYSTFNADNLQL
jgi:hypothetical protein